MQRFQIIAERAYRPTNSTEELQFLQFSETLIKFMCFFIVRSMKRFWKFKSIKQFFKNIYIFFFSSFFFYFRPRFAARSLAGICSFSKHSGPRAWNFRNEKKSDIRLRSRITLIGFRRFLVFFAVSGFVSINSKSSRQTYLRISYF